MLKFVKCVQLYSAVPKKHMVTFDRDIVTEEDNDLSLSFKTDISEDNKKKPKKTKLTFGVIAKSQQAEGTKPAFSALIEIDYLFHVKDLETYMSLSDDEQLDLCSSLVFLDFRRRIINSFSSVGLQGVKLPLSLHALQEDE
ncbi:TPA: hypothetical protein ACGD5E_000313 [Serratia marcescens]